MRFYGFPVVGGGAAFGAWLRWWLGILFNKCLSIFEISDNVFNSVSLITSGHFYLGATAHYYFGLKNVSIIDYPSKIIPKIRFNTVEQFDGY